MGAADNFFGKAEQALKKRNYDYAIELYQQGLAIDPDRLEERKMLRATEVRRIQENGGNTMGGAAMKFKNLGLLGKIKKLGMGKKWEEQILEIEKLLREAPQNPDQNMNLAMAFQHTDRHQSAVWSYSCVLEVAPQNVDALKALGRLYEKLGELDKAIECWERVRGARPEDQEAGKAVRDLAAATMLQRSDQRRKDGQSDGSYRDLLKDTDESSKLEQKQKIIRTEDDRRVAIDLKLEEIEADPTNARLWRELGSMQVKASDFVGARSSYEKALEVDPQDMYAADGLSSLRSAELEHQVSASRKVLQEQPGDAQAKQRLDQLRREQNEFLLEDLPRKVKAHPTDYGMKFKLGELYQKNQRYDEAIAQYQNSAKDPKQATNSHYRIGQCFHAKKLYDLAAKQYLTALQALSEPDSELAKSVRYDLAKAYRAKNDNDKALELFEEIMAVDINFRDVSKQVDEIRGL